MYKPFHSGNLISIDRNAMDDTTTLIFKRLDKVDKIAEDVHTIKSQMPHLATKDHVKIQIAEHAAKRSITPKGNGRLSGKMLAAIIASMVALAGAVTALAQAI